MADPTSYIAAKLASMIGGFFGGAAILTFIRPSNISEAFIRGGVSVGSAIIFATPALEFFKMATDWENQLMAGFCVGFLAYGILGMVANFLIKNQTKDIINVIKNIKK
jgi:hypothetical protein